MVKEEYLTEEEKIIAQQERQDELDCLKYDAEFDEEYDLDRFEGRHPHRYAPNEE